MHTAFNNNTYIHVGFYQASVGSRSLLPCRPAGAAVVGRGAAERRRGRRRSSSRLRSASGKLNVKSKVLVAAVLVQVKMPSWSRRPSACDKRSVKNKVLAAAVLDHYLGGAGGEALVSRGSDRERSL